MRSMQSQLVDWKIKYDRLSDEFKQHRDLHEQEINLRMQFESKLNHLHAVNRTFNETATKNSKIKEQQKEKLDL